MIQNKTQKFTIIEKARECRSALSKATGLMLRPRPDYGLVFRFNRPRRVSLTMWLVFYQIDVLYLDGNMKVVEIVKGFRPFTNYTPRSLANTVVELPTGRLGKTKVGDTIAISAD